MAKHNRKHNARPELPESVIIDLRGRNVGKEDLETALLRLQWVEHEGFKGSDLQVAAAIAQGLRKAIEIAATGAHEKAAKQAGNCLYTLKKNREAARKANRHVLGSITIECRDGMSRKIGDVVEYFVGVHARIAEQITEAQAAEAEAAELAELEQLQAAEALRTEVVVAKASQVKAA